MTTEEVRIFPGTPDRRADIARDEVDNSKFDAAKYAELKGYWAKGYSAAKTANMLKGKRGFGLRTIEKYWSVFNSIGEETTDETAFFPQNSAK
jgi:hypothetical protein